MGVALLLSTSIFPIFTLPWYSAASSSTIGAIALQGPHHTAQKSTKTGCSAFKTSWSKFASFTSMMPFAAILSSNKFCREFRPDAQTQVRAGSELLILGLGLDAT